MRGKLRCTAAIQAIEPHGGCAGGRCVLPGFIDLHVHGGDGADCMTGADAVRRMARSMRHGPRRCSRPRSPRRERTCSRHCAASARDVDAAVGCGQGSRRASRRARSSARRRWAPNRHSQFHPISTSPTSSPRCTDPRRDHGAQDRSGRTLLRASRGEAGRGPDRPHRVQLRPGHGALESGRRRLHPSVQCHERVHHRRAGAVGAALAHGSGPS